MQQSQVVGICILSGDCGRKIVYVDVKQKECQGWSLRDAVFQTSLPASLAVTGSEDKTFIQDKVLDHADHVFIRKKSQQLIGEATVPDSVIKTKQLAGLQKRQVFFASKQSSMFCVNKTALSSVDRPKRKKNWSQWSHNCTCSFSILFKMLLPLLQSSRHRRHF